MTAGALIAPIETRSRNRHLGYLDSLRGLAILLVFWVHAGIAGGIFEPAFTSHWTGPFFFVGQRGVELFYEVSAFTLFLSLSRSHAEQSPLRNFYLRRFFRIAPAFYVALLCDYLWVGHAQQAHWCYPLAAVFLNGWSSQAINFPVVGSWSVAVETAFYVVVPFLFRTIRNLRRALWFFLATWVVSYFGDRLLAHVFPSRSQYFIFFWPVAQIPVFAMGILAFRIYELLAEWRRTEPALADPAFRKTLSALLLATALVLVRADLGHTGGYVVEGSFCFMFLLLAGDLFAWPALFNRPLSWIGKISFSLYLFHFFPLHYFLEHSTFAHPPRWLPFQNSQVLASLCAFAAMCCIAMPVSWCTWRFLEVPGITLGRTLIRWLEGRPSASKPLPTDAEVSTPGFQF